jgi:hypothetical protein
MNSEKDLKKIRRIYKTYEPKPKRGRPKKRVRRELNSWDRIASQLGKLAKEGSIPTTGEGLKRRLQRMFSDNIDSDDIDFDKV